MKNAGMSSATGSQWEGPWRRQSSEGLRSRHPSGSSSSSTASRTLEQPQQQVISSESRSPEQSEDAGKSLVARKVKNAPLSFERVSNLINDVIYCGAISDLSEAQQKRFNVWGLAGRIILFSGGAWLAASNAAGLLATPVSTQNLLYFGSVITSVGSMYTFALGKFLFGQIDQMRKDGCCDYLKSLVTAENAACFVFGGAYGVSSVWLDKDNAYAGSFTLFGTTENEASAGVIAYANCMKYGNWFIECILPAVTFISLARSYWSDIKGIRYGDSEVGKDKNDKVLNMLKLYCKKTGELKVNGNKILFNKTAVEEIVKELSQNQQEFLETMADLKTLQFDKGRIKEILALWRGDSDANEKELTFIDNLLSGIRCRVKPLVNLGVKTACFVVTGGGLGITFASPRASSHYMNDFASRGLLRDPDNSTFPFGIDCALLQNSTINHIDLHNYNMQVASYYEQGGTFGVFPMRILMVLFFLGKTLFKDCDVAHVRRYLNNLLARVFTVAGLLALVPSIAGGIGYNKLIEGVEQDVIQFLTLLGCNIGVPYFGIYPNLVMVEMAKWLLINIVTLGTFDAWEGIIDCIISNFNPKAEERRAADVWKRNRITEPTYSGDVESFDGIEFDEMEDIDSHFREESGLEVINETQEAAGGLSAEVHQEAELSEIPPQDDQDVELPPEMPQNPAIQEARLNLNDTIQEMERMLSSLRSEDMSGDADSHRSSTTSAATVIDMRALDETFSGLRESDV